MRYLTIPALLLLSLAIASAQDTKEKQQETGKKVWTPPLDDAEKSFLPHIEDIGRCVPPNMRRDKIVDLGNRARGQEAKVRKELLKYAFDTVSEHLRTEFDYTVREACPGAISEIAAADASGEIKKLAVTELTKALKADKKNTVRAAAASYLAVLGAKEARSALIDALKNDRWSIVRAACIDAIAKLSLKEEIPALREALANDAHSIVRKSAASALTDFKDKESTELFIKGLKDPFSSVRTACCNALEIMPSPKALPALADLTKDGKEGVRDAAVKALAKLKEPGAVKALEGVLRPDEFESVRRSAINSLEEIGTKEAIDVIASKGLTDPDFQTKLTAIEAVCKLNDERGISALLAALKEQYQFRRVSSIELTVKHQIKDQRVLKALQELSKNDSSEEVKKKAKEALDKLRDSNKTSSWVTKMPI